MSWLWSSTKLLSLLLIAPGVEWEVHKDRGLLKNTVFIRKLRIRGRHRMCPYIACLRGCIITLVAFVLLFSTVCFHMGGLELVWMTRFPSIAFGSEADTTSRPCQDFMLQSTFHQIFNLMLCAFLQLQWHWSSSWFSISRPWNLQSGIKVTIQVIILS